MTRKKAKNVKSGAKPDKKSKTTDGLSVPEETGNNVGFGGIPPIDMKKGLGCGG